MKKLFITALAFSAMSAVYAQNTLITYVKDSRTREAVPGATVAVTGTALGAAADDHGLIYLTAIPAGRCQLRYSAMGYAVRTDSVTFPLPSADTLVVLLEAEELEEVSVSTTRSSRTIDDIPTRLEFVAGEELDEKANMKPGDIRMVLSESTGIQTLQTSATSGNSSIRIQGMDGRYTQVLRDGFPLYSGFSGGLGLLQTPPLDLKQLEIIKGSSSTLYGGGAIAGLVNLVSRTPTAERELRFLVNGTTAGGLDLSGFYGNRYGKTGVTLYAARNSSGAYDPAGIGLSAIPGFERYTINPRFYIYPDSATEIMIGINGVFEDRTGGDMEYIAGHGDSLHSYYERNNSQRISTQAALKRTLRGGSRLALRNSVDHFARRITTPGYTFDGRQLSTFTELTFSLGGENAEYIFGANLFTDAFREQLTATVPLRDYTHTTAGIFAQGTWDISGRLALEAGLRGDYIAGLGGVVLPRLSLLYKAGSHVSSRLGGGFGYKTPTIFTEESERIQYRDVLPVDIKAYKMERSYGVNWDVNFKASFGKFTFSVNQLFFYTYLDDPLMLTRTGSGLYSFVNIAGHIDARGAETNIKLGYGPFKLFLGYTYTHSEVHAGMLRQELPLTPRHHTNSVLMFEIEDKWKAGLEAYYYSSQLLSDGSRGRDYWLCGFMAERLWERFSVFVNFENVLDSRQTRFGSIYTGTLTQPAFTDIYAPLDGFVVNGGVKVKL